MGPEEGRWVIANVVSFTLCLSDTQILACPSLLPEPSHLNLGNWHNWLEARRSTESPIPSLRVYHLVPSYWQTRY